MELVNEQGLGLSAAQSVRMDAGTPTRTRYRRRAVARCVATH